MRKKISVAAAIAWLLLTQGQAFAACSTLGYARGSSPVAGGWQLANYPIYGWYQGGCCGIFRPAWGWVNGVYTHTSVTGTTAFYGSACYGAAGAYYISNGSQPTIYSSLSCPPNTAEIEVIDYRRADGVVMSGVSTVCVVTDTNE